MHILNLNFRTNLSLCARKAKIAVAISLLSILSAGLASTPNTVGEIVSERLTFESSGFWGKGRFTALPKGEWRILRKESLWGRDSTHTGYVLKSEDDTNAIALLVVVHSSTPNYWVPSFVAVPRDADAVNLYKTSSSSLITKQSFYFPNATLTNYQENWLVTLKVKETLRTTAPGKSLALSVTRNVDKNNDIRFMSFIKKEEQDSAFAVRVRAWNDQLVSISHDSFYEKKEGLGGLLTFRASSHNQALKNDASIPAGDSPTHTDIHLASSQPSNKIQAPIDTGEPGRTEDQRFQQQRTNLQKQLSADKPTTNTVSVASNLDNPKVLAKANRHALIIGNDDYRNVQRLENAVGDAKAIASLLSRLKYEVVTYNNLGEKQFKAVLRQFKQKLRGGDEVLFYFAGHGVQLGGANYLLPIDVGSDSEEQIRDEGIPLQRVLDDFSDSKVRFSLALIDACRDNPFKSKGRTLGGRGLGATSAANGQMIIFAAGAGQQALDRLGNNDLPPLVVPRVS